MKGNKIISINKQLSKKSIQSVTAILFIAILLTSCAPSLVQTNPTPQPVLQSTPRITNDQTNAVIAAAKSTLAEQLQLGIDAIQWMDIQQVQWPDGCLGVQEPRIMCAMHVVDGYRITLSANDQKYEVRSNLDGSQTVVVPGHASSSAPAQTQSDGIQITDFSSSIGGVDGNPDQQVISYNVTINNPNDNSITLSWLEPVLQELNRGKDFGDRLA